MSSGLQALSPLEPSPDPSLARLVGARLEGAHMTILAAARSLTAAFAPAAGPGSSGGSPATGVWRGPSADAARVEAMHLARALQACGSDGDRLARAVSRYATCLEADLASMHRVRADVLACLGRLATLPAELHRDAADAMARLAHGHGWHAEYPVPGPPGLAGAILRLPGPGSAGWTQALGALRRILP